jgi:Putative zincin peptidase
MFFIPGVLMSILTFPGVIVHELAHQLFCRWFNVPVFKVVYFKTGNPAGYVLHETVSNKWHAMLISIGPFFVNTIIGAFIAFPASIPVFQFDNATPADYLLIYLGVSIAMHAFPSVGDGKAIWQTIKESETPLLVKIIGYPIIGLIYLGSLGSFFWLDLAYGIAIAVGLPKLVVGSMA